MAVDPWGDTPEYADILTLDASMGGQQIEVAISAKKGTGTATTTVRFKESPDGGATYPSAFVTVGTIPKAAPLLIRHMKNDDLKIGDGAKWLFLSTNGGANWSAL